MENVLLFIDAKCEKKKTIIKTRNHGNFIIIIKL